MSTLKKNCATISSSFSKLEVFMPIWKQEITLSLLQQRHKHSLSDFLGIEFIKIEEKALFAKMPFSEKTRQPFGLLHGGANAVLAETLGSIAAYYCTEESFSCVGLELNINHIRPISSGSVIGKTSPIHLGKKTQVWHIEIYSEQTKKPTAISRLTVAVLEKDQSKN